MSSAATADAAATRGNSQHDDDDDNSEFELYENDDSDRESDDDEDRLMEEEENVTWKNLLGLPARAGWRSSDAFLPPHVIEAQERVLRTAVTGGITNKQLKQSLTTIVSQHKALGERRERERRRLINGTYYTKSAQRRDDAIQPVLYGRQETLAALKNRLQPNYCIAKRVLEETKSLLSGFNNNFRPKRVIDMGIGVGSASAAALEIFPNDIEWIHGIDPSRCMRECAKSFLEDIMEESVVNNSNIDINNPVGQDGEEPKQEQPRRINPPRLTLGGSIATSGESSSSSATAGTFDLALMAYTATELPHVSSTLAACAILWQKLANNGVLIIIEPGTPDGFNTIRAVRNMLLDCCPPSSSPFDSESSSSSEAPQDQNDQCHIIAPCTHNGKCPMERYQRDFFQKPHHPKTQMDMEDLDNTTTSADTFDDDHLEDMSFESLDFSRQDTNASIRRRATTSNNKRNKTRQQQITDQTHLLGGRYCSFVQTMSSGSGSHLFRRGEKFSYLVAQKRRPLEQQQQEEGEEGGGIDNENANKNKNKGGGSFHNDRLRDLLVNVYKANEEAGNDDHQRQRRAGRNQESSSLETQQSSAREKVQELFEEAQALESKYLDSEEDDLGLEFLQGDANRSSYGRIVRAPLKRRGHVYIDYCAAPGRLIRSKVTKSLAYSVAPGLYTAARKSRWGGLWPDVAPPATGRGDGER